MQVPRVLAIFVCVATTLFGMSDLGQATTRRVDLKEEAASKVSGAYNVASAGDVNGDDVPDALFSEGEPGIGPSNGRVYVVFGPLTKRIDLDQLGDKGFVIHGAKPGDYASQISGAGDVNGDGFDDVIVGAPEADNNARPASGTAYVVYGKASTLPVHLALFDANAQGPLGFRIDGAQPGDLAARVVAAAGDVNRDGLDDLLVAAPFAGSTYLVFGHASPVAIDLLLFDMELQIGKGYRIDTPVPQFDNEYSVASARDVNRDGTPDAAIGVMTSLNFSAAYIVFGKGSDTPVDVTKSGEWGFVIRDGGWPVAGVGDVNGDRYSDIVTATHVIFGKTSFSTVNTRRIASNGFTIHGRATDQLGSAVSGIGDLNGDGLADIVIGAASMDSNRRVDSGSTFVIFGQKSSNAIHTRSLKNLGIRIDGANPGDASGSSLAGVPDMNGDGKPEILIGTGGGIADDGYLVWGERARL